MPKDDAGSSRLGQILRDRWLLEQTLGAGGMAVVYAARHRNGARAAIKLLHGPLRDDATMKERFLREAYLANTVNHPGIVRVLDDDEDPQHGPFIIMELLEGESIDELFKRRVEIPLDKVLDIADQVLDVLGAAHDRGIVHRDLKPANLFLCRDGAVKVLDFGIARLLYDNAARLTHTGMMVGTPAYMSPEQARTSGKFVDGRSDLYSLGATMFRILSGRHVHVGKLAQLIVQVATERAPKLASVAPQVPQAVCLVVDRSIEFEPERRYATAREMQTDVRALRHGQNPPIAGKTLPAPPPVPALDAMPMSSRGRTEPPPESLHAKDAITMEAERARQAAREAAQRPDAFQAPAQQPPQPQAYAQQQQQHAYAQQQQHAYAQQQHQQQQQQQAYAQQQQAYAQQQQAYAQQQQQAQAHAYAQPAQQPQGYYPQQPSYSQPPSPSRPDPPPGWQPAYGQAPAQGSRDDFKATQVAMAGDPRLPSNGLSQSQSMNAPRVIHPPLQGPENPFTTSGSQPAYVPSAQPPPPAQPIAAPPKKSGAGAIIAIVLLVLAVLAGAGWYVATYVLHVF